MALTIRVAEREEAVLGMLTIGFELRHANSTEA